MASLPSTHPNTDSSERGYQRIRLRQDTEANWAKNDPLLASGEMGYVIGAQSPSQMLKVGDGTRRWSELNYIAAQGNSGPPGPPGPDGRSVKVYGPSESPPSPFNVPLRAGDVWLSNGLYAKNPSFDPEIIEPGAKGDPGEAATIDGVTAVPLAPGSDPTVVNTGTVNNAYFTFGIPTGAPAYFSEPVATVDDLPMPGQPGQCVMTEDTGRLYSWNVVNQSWTDAGQIRP